MIHASASSANANSPLMILSAAQVLARVQVQVLAQVQVQVLARPNPPASAWQGANSSRFRHACARWCLICVRAAVCDLRAHFVITRTML